VRQRQKNKIGFRQLRGVRFAELERFCFFVMSKARKDFRECFVHELPRRQHVAQFALANRRGVHLRRKRIIQIDDDFAEQRDGDIGERGPRARRQPNADHAIVANDRPQKAGHDPRASEHFAIAIDLAVV